MIKIICLNGAPRSGKDTVGEILKSLSSDVSLMKFAAPLDDIAKTILAVPEEQYRVLREEKKDQLLEGSRSTMRDLLIGISENLLKPIFGRTYFADAAADKIHHHLHKYRVLRTEPSDIFVITDCGFQYEYDRFKERMDELKIPTKLVQIQRDGTSFEGDSREFVTDPKQYSLMNNGTLEDLKAKVEWLLSDACCAYCHEHPNKACPTPL